MRWIQCGIQPVWICGEPLNEIDAVAHHKCNKAGTFGLAAGEFQQLLTGVGLIARVGVNQIEEQNIKWASLRRRRYVDKSVRHHGRKFCKVARV
jgi:hypothetical protein